MSRFSYFIVHINEYIYQHVPSFNRGILNDKNFGKNVSYAILVILQVQL